SVTEVHGIAVVEPERARTLVMAMMLGNGGQELLQQFATEAAGRGSRSAYWGEFITKNLPRTALGPLTDRVRSAFLRRFAVTQGTSVVGRAIPFGIGAVIGGAGNNILGRRIVRSAREAFPAAPDTFPASLDAVTRAPKAAKPPKPPRVAGAPRAPRQVGARRALSRRSPAPSALPALPAPPPPAADQRRPD
ncbi:MAG: hypothetical protein ABIP33_04170, partial [Pseudolysinimonas sp.]